MGASTSAPNSFFISLIAFQPIREGVLIFREGEIFFCEGENKLCEGKITAYYRDGIRYEWMYLPQICQTCIHSCNRQLTFNESERNGLQEPCNHRVFLPPSKIVTTNYLMDSFFFNFFHFFFNSCPQKLFVKNTSSQKQWWQECNEGGRTPATLFILIHWKLAIGYRSVC